MGSAFRSMDLENTLRRNEKDIHGPAPLQRESGIVVPVSGTVSPEYIDILLDWLISIQPQIAHHTIRSGKSLLVKELKQSQRNFPAGIECVAVSTQ